MVFIQHKDIFTNAIKDQSVNLSDKMIDSISFILSLIENDTPNEIKRNNSVIYATNIAIHLQSSNNRTYTAYELVIAALGNKVTVVQDQFIKTLSLMNSNIATTIQEDSHKQKLSNFIGKKLIKT